MTEKGINAILQTHLNQQRIKQLEALIPEQEKALQESRDIATISRMNLHIYHLKLEYKEITGREYK